MVETNPNFVQAPTDTVIVDVMPEGFAIEKDPTPIARVALDVPALSTEAVLGRITREEKDDGQGRFVPYSPQHMELDEAGDTLVAGISLANEDGVVKPVLAEPEAEPKSGAGKAKELIQAAKRSRVGKAVAAIAVTSGGALSMASPAKAEDGATATAASSRLKRECAADIFKFKRSQILDNTMRHPGKSSQSININLDFDAVDPACNGHFVRKVSVLPQLIRHGHIINENPNRIPLLQGRGFNYATQAGLLDFNSLHDPKRYWQSGDKARFELRLEELSVQAKKVVNAVTKIEPIEVERHKHNKRHS